MASVRCSRCQADIAKDAKFCSDCGAENSMEQEKERKTANPELQMLNDAGGLEALLDRVSQKCEER
eukprot:2638589-Karenia_brevis.AAC.1